jgi:hypothetical protein
MVNVNVNFFVRSLLSNSQDLIRKKHLDHSICSFWRRRRSDDIRRVRTRTKDQVYNADICYKGIAKYLAIGYWQIKSRQIAVVFGI